MTRIFLTGASGYIGGDVLHLLLKSHPAFQVRVLVRDQSKGAAITKAFSQVEIVHGSLDDTDVIAKEAQEADIVLHLAATGHLESVQTIYTTLSKKPKGPRSPYYIQISGASVLAAGELADKTRVFGSGSDVMYNDLTGVDSIKTFIKQYPSRAVDNYILSVNEQNSPVKTALVVPPIIYGQARGPGNQRSMQIPDLANATLKRQRGLQVGSGESRWGNIHIQDLSRIFLQLIEKAVEGSEDDSIWGANGIFFTGAGEMVGDLTLGSASTKLTNNGQSFSDISQRVATAAHDFNLIPSNEVDQVNADEIDRIIPRGSVLLGTNARAGADRAKATLGWEPEMESLEEHIPQAVINEARALGMNGKDLIFMGNLQIQERC
ncbi:nucleoside-diphosphate-sugar epimerase [Fusarium sporotrichioides]|uniref:Nucleoside-diphosphate-sugar epimerase n=1 Tax=Fusarium sporotrichioides TaxID=5514 RepID=A0A395RYR3_FUSSP|nr:nucleoside-diphosphate-sugar epimerase [Fusarium sporotrichioides]